MRNGQILSTSEDTGDLSFSFERSAGLEVQRLIEARCETRRPCVGIVACVRMRTLLNGHCEAVSECSMMLKRDGDFFWNENGREPDGCPASPTFDVLHPHCVRKSTAQLEIAYITKAQYGDGTSRSRRLMRFLARGLFPEIDAAQGLQKSCTGSFVSQSLCWSYQIRLPPSLGGCFESQGSRFNKARGDRKSDFLWWLATLLASFTTCRKRCLY